MLGWMIPHYCKVEWWPKNFAPPRRVQRVEEGMHYRQPGRRGRTEARQAPPMNSFQTTSRKDKNAFGFNVQDNNVQSGKHLHDPESRIDPEPDWIERFTSGQSDRWSGEEWVKITDDDLNLGTKLLCKNKMAAMETGPQASFCWYCAGTFSVDVTYRQHLGKCPNLKLRRSGKIAWWNWK